MAPAELVHGEPARAAVFDGTRRRGFREQHTDAVATVISDQELAGLDILTNGDFHLDFDLAGRSWFSYPSERLSGASEFDTETNRRLELSDRHLAQRDRRRLEVPRDRRQGRPARAARVREDLARRAIAHGQAGEVRDDRVGTSRRRCSPFRPMRTTTTSAS